MVTGLSTVITQDEFGRMVGVSQQRVAAMIGEGVLTSNGTAGQWLLAYTERLRQQAAGRGQELTVERAALARAQRIGQEIKNAVTQGDYAPIGLLTDVLAAASSAMVSQIDTLDAVLSRTCPQLDDEARTQVLNVINAARNKWVRGTATLTRAALAELLEGEDDAPTEDGADEDTLEDATP